MKSLPLFSIAALLPAAVFAVDIPESVPGDPGSGTNPGFIVRSVQAPDGSELPITLNRGLFQLNGTLTDSGGNLFANEVEPGSGPGGAYVVETVINFEKDAIAEDEGPITNFPDNALFPGIPGTGGHTNDFTTEVVAFLELTAGEHTFGGQVWIDRTDAGGGGNDDLFAVYSASNPRDFFATKLGEAVRSPEAPPFAAVPDDTEFTFTAPVDGLYPFRLVYIQKVGAAGLEWYSVDPGSNEKILINDPEDERSIKAFQNSTAAHHNHPYIAEVRPQPGSSGIEANAPIEILLVDDGAFVDQSSIELLLNDVDITDEATITNANGQTKIVYEPNPARMELGNAIQLTYADTAGRVFMRAWDFEISAGLGVTQVTGQWDFENGLEATFGRDLEFLSSYAMDNTEFGTTTQFGIPDIDGEIADVMMVPDEANPEIGYVMYHGMMPNGGGTRVNQYTLLMDVMVTGDGAAGIIQIDSPRPGAGQPIPNTGDSDFFWQGNNMGQGGGGYNGTGIFTPDEWHRIAFAVDLAADPPLVTKYVDAIKQDDWVQTGIDQPRRALLAPDGNPDLAYAILLTDGDDGEQNGWFVSSVQIREGKMSDVEIEELGGPKAEGFPRPESFDNPNVTSRRRNIYGDLGLITEPEIRRIVVRNTGESEDLVISAVTPSGPDAEFFTVTAFPETLATAEEGSIDVSFDPQGQSGLFEAILEVASNDPGDPVTTIDVTARVKNPAGLIAHYRMDETEGEEMLDASGQRYHGTYGAGGAGSFTLGEAALASGNSVRFSDGGDPTAGGGFGQLSADAGIPTLQSLTISMWLEPDAADVGGSMLLAKGTVAGDPFALATNAVGDPNPLLWFNAEAEVIVTDPVMTVGETHHVVVTHEDANGLEPGATRSRIYLDGQLVSELEDAPGYQDLAPSVIQIGALNGGFGFTGLIDDVQIYDRELSADEVNQLFSNPGEVITEAPVSTDPVDVTQPGDPVVRVDGENDTDAEAGPPPATEMVEHVIDDLGQKHLNFLDLGSGFIVTPSMGATIVDGLRLYPANDAPERDPASYVLEGSATGPDGPFALISEGALALPEERTPADAVINPAGFAHQVVEFENDTVYLSYRLTFPTLRDAETANSMQIAEVEFLGVAGTVDPGDPASPNLVGYWRADEGSGTVVSSAVDPALNGALNAGGWSADGGGHTGQPGDYAFEVTGADDGSSHVEVPATGKTFEQITITGWVNGAQTADWTGLIQARGGAAPDQPIGIGYSAGTGNLTYTWNNDAAETYNFQSGLAIPTDEWAFVALAITPERAILYVGADGVLNSAVNEIPHLAQSNENSSWFFGKDNCCGDAPTRNFDGFMDAISIWDVALSEADLQALFDGTETPFTLVPTTTPPVMDLQPFAGITRTEGGGVSLTLPAGLTLDIEYSVDLVDWEVIDEDVTGTFEDTDAARTSLPAGFYRGSQ